MFVLLGVVGLGFEAVYDFCEWLKVFEMIFVKLE